MPAQVEPDWQVPDSAPDGMTQPSPAQQSCAETQAAPSCWHARGWAHFEVAPSQIWEQHWEPLVQAAPFASHEAHSPPEQMPEQHWEAPVQATPFVLQDGPEV